MRDSRIIVGLLVVAGILAFAGFYSMLPDEEPETPMTAASTGGSAVADEPGPYLVIELAGQAEGEVVIDLYEETAPKHAERLTRLAEEGAYDEVVFHRVIDGFMAQTGDVAFGRAGGDMRRAGTGGSGQPDLPAEFSDIPFVRGTVGMARAQNVNSANSQFFIMFDEGAFLNGQYTVIGEVVEGMAVVDRIKRGTGPNGAVVGEPDRMVSVSVRR